MRCPKCLFEETKVLDSRPGKGNASIRRRRQCLNCSHRFSTVEEILKEDLVVIKRDGRREDFDSPKLIRGVQKAAEKRPISAEVIENLVQEVTFTIQNQYDCEVPSKAIGEEVIKRLKKIDQIAYVRFASVYKDFRDIAELAEEINSLNSQGALKPIENAS